MNSEITAALEEKFPAPERWFDVKKWSTHQEFVENRAREIVSQMRETIASYAAAKTRDEVKALDEKFARLSAEHENLFGVSIDDDRFYSSPEEV